jgi:hypothetical protein
VAAVAGQAGMISTARRRRQQAGWQQAPALRTSIYSRASIDRRSWIYSRSGRIFMNGTLSAARDVRFPVYTEIY